MLELADRLELTPDQTERTRAVHARMLEDAKRIGRDIVTKEAALDSLFAEGRVTPAELASATAEIGRLTGELRSAHLSAYLEMRRILTPAQIARYDALRGYGAASPHDPSARRH